VPGAGQVVEHCIERNFRLQTRQRCAQTEVDATPETKMPVRLAFDIEMILNGYYLIGLSNSAMSFKVSASPGILLKLCMIL
jgi:hypothetical protein